MTRFRSLIKVKDQSFNRLDRTVEFERRPLVELMESKGDTYPLAQKRIVGSRRGIAAGGNIEAARLNNGYMDFNRLHGHSEQAE